MALLRARPEPTDDALSRLIERDAAQAALRTHLDHAVSGRGRFVVVRGEAGIGKTALLRSFLASAGDDGVTILAKLDVPRRGSIAAAIGPTRG